MTKFTKVSNFIFRGTIVAALGATVMQLVSSGALFGKLFEGAKNTTEVLANTGRMDFSGILSQGHIITIALLLAAVLSIVAFKASGKAASIFRTISLFGMAGITCLGTALFSMADVASRTVAGTATAAEIANAKPFMDAVLESGHSQSAAAGAFGISGALIAFVVAAVLTILTVTSIVSVVKTVKADTCEA